jgi:hypothetical protein
MVAASEEFSSPVKVGNNIMLKRLLYPCFLEEKAAV